MTGFELIVNGEKISAGLENGVFSIILTRIINESVDSIDLDFTGLNISDPTQHEMVDWHRSNLKIGDELIIRIADIKNVSTPINKNRESLESIEAQELANYYNMKKNLEEKGLI